MIRVLTEAGSHVKIVISHPTFLEFQYFKMPMANSTISASSNTAITTPTSIPPSSPPLIPMTTSAVTPGTVPVGGVVPVEGVVPVVPVVSLDTVVETVRAVVAVGWVVRGGQSGARRLSRITGQDGSTSSRGSPTLIDAVPVPTHACSSCTSPAAL